MRGDIKLADGTISREEIGALIDWLGSDPQLTKGPVTLEFEKTFSRMVDSPHALFVNSGSSANFVALYALKELGKAGKGVVIVPAVSWVTTVAPAMQLGMNVHMCDCSLDNLGMDLDHLEELCRLHGPGVVMLVHVLGHPNHMGKIMEICSRYGMTIVEDACEAFGTIHRGKHMGTWGEAGTFSFYYGHQISTIEGGMVVVPDKTVANVIKSIRAHGWARDLDSDVREAWELSAGVDEFRSLYTFYHAGFNFRSTDVNALLGLSQLVRARDMVTKRQQNFEKYRELLADKFWVQRSDYDVLSSLAFGTLVANPTETYRYLRTKGIESRPLVCGSIGRQPFWIKEFGETRLPNADVVHDFGMYLPNHANLADSDIERVVSAFREIAVPFELVGCIQ